MIIFNDNYEIETDKHNWILYEYTFVTEKNQKNYKSSKVGDKVLVRTTYHGTLQQLLTSMLERKRKNIGRKATIEEYIARLEKMQTKFLKEISNFKIEKE